MKNVVTFVIVLFSLLFAGEKFSIENREPLRMGVGGLVGSDRFAGSIQMWVYESFGGDMIAYRSWDSKTEGGEGHLKFKWKLPANIRPYVLLGGGIQRVDLDDISRSQSNIIIPYLVGGVGGEAIFGKKKQHGISLETEYSLGKIEYRDRSVTTIGVGSGDIETREKWVDPFSIRLVYHFYPIIVKKKVYDQDGDKIIDLNDHCPAQAEDFDGFSDSDGCPDTDNDGDGVVDSLDKCAAIPEDLDGFNDKDGCPDIDNDGDGIVDSLDKCPSQAETKNGFEDADGCSDNKPVEVTNVTALPSMTMVNFSINSFELSNTAKQSLDTIVLILTKQDDYSVSIAGYTDTRGESQLNRELSQNRADAIKLYLTSKGISVSRITARGFGSINPVASNENETGRQHNRRVEITLTK